MTLIAAQLNRHGIVLATDSNLTDTATDAVAGQARKNFELPHLRGGMSVAGGWNVGGLTMDVWMPRFIARPETYKSGTLREFSECLRAALESEMTPTEKGVHSLIHVAGYALDNSIGFHPEFWLVTNVYGMTEREYDPPRDTFKASEEFWDHHCQYKSQPTGFIDDIQYMVYANGYPPGRVGYMAVQHFLRPFFETMWGPQQNLGFRPPQSLQESVCLVRLFMSMVNGLFDVSDQTRYVGGETQIIAIPLPSP